MREIASPLSGPFTTFGQTPIDIYKVGAYRPELAYSFYNEYYRRGRQPVNFLDAITHTRNGNATMTDSSGNIVWAPHNLALNSATPATQSITVVSGADYTVECTGVSIALSGAGTGTVTEGNPVEITASTTTLTLTVTGSSGTMWAYRSDLGGMADVPLSERVIPTATKYVPTTDAARYLPRVNHHAYNGSQWVNKGLLVESEARTQLLHTTDALVTQSHTVTAVPHTLHFTGTGTVTLLGASTAGPLVGTGTGENNRVSLTFTPTAGTLILTVSGTVSDAQLEVGPTPSSYIPNLASSGSVTRAAETITIPAANLPWPSPVYVTNEELVTNGTFDSDVSGWTIAQAVGTVDTLRLKLTNSGAIFGYATQAFVTEIGKVYKVSCDFVKGTAASGYLRAGTTPLGLNYVNTARSTDGEMSGLFVAQGTTTYVHVLNENQTDAYNFYDNISVKEIKPLSLSIQMSGEMTYADDDTKGQYSLFQWYKDSGERIQVFTDTRSADTGQLYFSQAGSGVTGEVISSPTTYSPGVNVPFNISSRHGSTFINGAVDGVALTANTTPVALPDLSSTDLSLGYDFMGTISLFRMWANDLGDTGIEEASA